MTTTDQISCRILAEQAIRRKRASCCSSFDTAMPRERQDARLHDGIGRIPDDVTNSICPTRTAAVSSIARYPQYARYHFFPQRYGTLARRHAHDLHSALLRSKTSSTLCGPDATVEESHRSMPASPYAWPLCTAALPLACHQQHHLTVYNM